MVAPMNPRRRPIERTRQLDIWAEHASSPIGAEHYRLVLQLVDRLDDPDATPLLRAGYRRDGVMRPSQPMFGADQWVEVLEQAIADPECFTDEQVVRLSRACARRATGA
jgi:hypothetical protein